MIADADSSDDDRASVVAAALVRRRLVWPCALLLLLSSIDRTNISFAAAPMNRALGMNDAQYGLGAGIFFVGYVLGQLPSVLLLERIRFRRWIAAVSALWGVCAVGTAFVHTPTAFYALRILLGLAEAGLAPGIVLYLSRWSDDRARATLIAIPIAAIPVSVVIAGPLSGVLLGMANPLALESWRWMFLIEGLPTILLSAFAFWYFPDRPSDAVWLKHPSRVSLDVAAAADAARERSASGWRDIADGRVWLCALLWFCLLAGNYGIIFWLPQAVRSVAGLDPLETGFVVALPWLANVAGILWSARHSDRTGERFLHIAVPSFLSGAALLLAYAAGASWAGLTLLILLGGLLGCGLGPYWAVPLRLLPDHRRAVGTAVINVLGGISGLIVPALFGVLHQGTGSFALPAGMLAVLIAAGGGVALAARAVERGGAAAG